MLLSVSANKDQVTPVHHRIVVTLMVLALASPACTNSADRSFLTLNYQRAAAEHGPDRNPIVVVPGLLGTTLRDTSSDRFIWGGFDNLSVDPKSATGLRLLALPLTLGSEGRISASDDIEPTWVLERATVRLLGLPFNLDVYAGILGALGVGGYRDESLGTAGVIDYGDDHFTCFQYPYDWRRDIVESAQRLGAFLDDKRAYIQAEYRDRFGIDNADVRFDLVAHSMGALVARYFLMYGGQDLPADGSLPPLTWAGAEYLERVVLVAPPNAGSVLTVRNLVEGHALGPFQPTYSATLLGTYPSTYQLLPRNTAADRCLERHRRADRQYLFAGALARAGLGPGRSAQRSRARRVAAGSRHPGRPRCGGRSVAEPRLLARAEHLHRALDRPASLPDSVELMLVVGDNRKTARTIGVDRDDGRVRIRDFGDGDGTVLRTSALHDQRRDDNWSPGLTTPLDYDVALFLPDSHTNLTGGATFTDNVLYWLLEDPRTQR